MQPTCFLYSLFSAIYCTVSKAMLFNSGSHEYSTSLKSQQEKPFKILTGLNRIYKAFTLTISLKLMRRMRVKLHQTKLPTLTIVKKCF